MAARCSADAMVRVGGFKLRGVRCSELGWTRDLCDHSWSQPFLGHPAASDVPALGHEYLPSVSSVVETAAALLAWSREVTPGRGTWPQPGKTMCRRQTRPCSHPPPSPRAAESRSPGVQMEECSQSFSMKLRNPSVCSPPTREDVHLNLSP